MAQALSKTCLEPFTSVAQTAQMPDTGSQGRLEGDCPRQRTSIKASNVLVSSTSLARARGGTEYQAGLHRAM